MPETAVIRARVLEISRPYPIANDSPDVRVINQLRFEDCQIKGVNLPTFTIELPQSAYWFMFAGPILCILDHERQQFHKFTPSYG